MAHLMKPKEEGDQNADLPLVRKFVHVLHWKYGHIYVCVCTYMGFSVCNARNITNKRKKMSCWFKSILKLITAFAFPTTCI